MTNEQIKVFNDLLASDNFKGKAQLSHLLWLNTSKPKFKVGDCFVISDGGQYVYGYPVKGFKAQINRVYSWKDQEEWQYELIMSVVCGDKSVEATTYKSENELIRAEQCADNKNILGEAKTSYANSCDA